MSNNALFIGSNTESDVDRYVCFFTDNDTVVFLANEMYLDGCITVHTLYSCKFGKEKVKIGADVDGESLKTFLVRRGV